MVPGPAGRAVRTRMRVTPGEAALLEAVGAHLTRLRLADLQAAAAGVTANHRAKALVGQAQARYAGTMVRDNDALARLVRDVLYRYRRELRGAVALLMRRVNASTWDSCCRATKRRNTCDRCRHGYRTRAERAMKCRRLDARRARLTEVERRIAEQDWRLLPGGWRLAGSRHHLEQAQLTVEQWRAEWLRRRFFLGAMGNAGALGGNPCLSIKANGRLTLSVPPPVSAALGLPSRVTLTAGVVFRHGGEELAARVAGRQATRFDIERVERKGAVRWYLRASWSLRTGMTPSRGEATADGVIGVDLNADHLATHLLDRSGNPVGRPHRIELRLWHTDTGRPLPSGTRDARLREAIAELLDRATASGIDAIVVEDLGFAIAEQSRERHGRNRRFRALIASFPTSTFRHRLIGMAHRRGLAVISVDPRYTSVVGRRDWMPALSNTLRRATGHDGAAVAIGRRGLALPLRARRKIRRAAGVRPVPHRRMEAATTRVVVVERTPAPGQQPERASDAPKSARSRPGPRTGSGRGTGGPGNQPTILPAHRRRRERPARTAHAAGAGVDA